MKITLEQLKYIFPETLPATLALVVEPLNETFTIYGINTKVRIAAFLAQVGHESGGFRFRKENLNYSAQGLLKTFPKYFNSALANSYARKPESIASRVYANRMGNGNEASAEGWKYRGRGYIQLTGKDNYTLFGKSLKMTPEQTIMFLETIKGACISAGWFWNSRGLNALADANKFDQITQKINGGQNGAPDRKNKFAKALTVIH